MTGTRINGRDMVLLIDSIDRSDEASSWALNYGTRQTFADMRGGATPKRLDMTINQDLDPTSLYTKAMAGVGTSLTGLLKPLGNEAPSEASPALLVQRGPPRARRVTRSWAARRRRTRPRRSPSTSSGSSRTGRR